MSFDLKLESEFGLVPTAQASPFGDPFSSYGVHAVLQEGGHTGNRKGDSIRGTSAEWR